MENNKKCGYLTFLVMTIGILAIFSGCIEDPTPREVLKERAYYDSVEVEYPREVLKEDSPWSNVNGPIWRWEVTFKGLNGTKITLNRTSEDFISDKGHWYDYDIKEIIITPKGSGTDDNWVSSPSCNLCGATAKIKYTGKDEYGNLIEIPIEILLLNEWKDGRSNS